MKKFSLYLILVTIFTLANAQVDKGRTLIGGSTNLSFSTQSTDGVDDNFNTFNLDFRGGYFVVDNLVAGLNLGFTKFTQGDDEFSITGIGPFARYYMNGTLYAGLGIDYESQNDGNESVNGSQIKIEVGSPIFIGGGETVAIEPALNYWIGGGDLNENTNTFALTVGFYAYF